MSDSAHRTPTASRAPAANAADIEDTAGKADFSSIYNADDARRFYATLGGLDYTIPQHGAVVLKSLLDVYPRKDREPLTILDLCCSYGVGGLLAKTNLTLDDLYRHYQHAADAGTTRDELVQRDVELLARQRCVDPPRVIGLDVAENATRYATEVGALDEAFAENLEAAEPSDQLVQQIQGVDVITTTGGIGYVTERTFDALLGIMKTTPWVAAFCLRTYDYEPIASTLAKYGLVTEMAEQSFRQRRCTDDAEQRWATAEVTARGFDATSLEADGHLFANFYLSRPEPEVAACPLPELIPVQLT